MAREITNQKSTTSLNFTPDSAYLVAASRSGSIHQWSIHNGVEVGPSTMKASGPIHAVVVSADGRWIVCGGPGKMITIWSTDTQKQVIEVAEHTGDIYALDVSGDSARFVSGSADKTVRIFDIISGTRLISPLPHEATVSGVKFSPDGSRIAAAVLRCSFVGVYDAYSGHKLFEIPVTTRRTLTTPLAWSSDGQRLFAASSTGITCLDTSASTARLMWSVPGSGKRVSVVASNKFIACSAGASVSFWDSASHKQIGNIINHVKEVDCIAISHDARYLACGHGRGITVHNLEGLLPESYRQPLPVTNTSSVIRSTLLPLVRVSDAVLESWIQGDPAKTETMLSDEIAQSSARDLIRRHNAIATRALIRTHLGEWRAALQDAEMSLQIEQSPIGQIARSAALVGVGEQEVALDDLGLVFCDCDPSDAKLLLVINSILLFVCNKHNQAISRLRRIIDSCDEKMKDVCLQVLGMMYLKQGDYENAVQTLGVVKNPFTVQERGHLMTIFIIFNWNFENLKLIAWQRLCETLSASGSMKEVGGILLGMVSPLPEDKRELAHGRILQEIMNRSGEATLLAWTGKSSAYNSCLPSSPAAYAQTSTVLPSPTLQEGALRKRTAELWQILPLADALMTYGSITRSQTVRFAHFHLHLPCIVFHVQSLRKEAENVHHAGTVGLGEVEFTTVDVLPLKEPQKLVFVYPWVHQFRESRRGAMQGHQDGQGPEVGLNSTSSNDGADVEPARESVIEEVPTTPIVDTGVYTRALQLMARLGQPFTALLLLEQSDGAYKRVAADHEIVVRGIEDDALRDLRVEVLEVL